MKDISDDSLTEIADSRRVVVVLIESSRETLLASATILLASAMLYSMTYVSNDFCAFFLDELISSLNSSNFYFEASSLFSSYSLLALIAPRMFSSLLITSSSLTALNLVDSYTSLVIGSFFGMDFRASLIYSSDFWINADPPLKRFFKAGIIFSSPLMALVSRVYLLAKASRSSFLAFWRMLSLELMAAMVSLSPAMETVKLLI